MNQAIDITTGTAFFDALPLTRHALPQLATHHEKIEDSHWVLCFHGTEKSFLAPDFAKVGVGTDANSTLGFYVTTSPANAAGYADMVCEGDDGAVLVTLARQARPYEFDTFEDFYGRDWPGGDKLQDRAYFERLRGQLLSNGHDSAWFSLDDEGVIGVALAPDHVVVLGAITRAQAWSLQGHRVFHGYLAPEAPADKRKVLQALEQVLAGERACS